MKLPASILAISLAFAVSASAANITWVSFHGGDDAPSGDAATAGLTQASDVGYTDLLAGAGHNVSRFVTKDSPDAADLAVMNASDLVVISRAVNSGNYQQADETSFWNTMVTKPVIIMGGYLLRNIRLNYTDGETMVDTAGPTTLTVSNTAHPIFTGISFTGNTMDNTFADIVTTTEVTDAGLQTQRGISVNNNTVVGGTVLASGASGDGTDGGMFIGEWDTGAIINNSQVLAGPRMVFLSGSREASGLTSQAAGFFDLSADGSQIFLNAVDYMAIPEPSALLLGLAGGWLLVARRRR